MHLVIDIGNTRAKAALFSKNKILVQSIASHPEDLKPMLAGHNPTHGIISSVAQSAAAWISSLPNIQWLELNHRTPVPFKNQYKTPSTLGLDRVALAAAAATQFLGKNTLVIDAGTCITYDLITQESHYLGGAISPGLQMRLRAMHHFTHRLPLVEVNPQVLLIENTTSRCLQSGAMHGLAAEIDGYIQRCQEQYEGLQVVLTGGDAEILAPLIKNSIFAHPNFLQEGLHAILVHNIS